MCCQAGLRLHPSPAKGLQIIHGPVKISLPTAPFPSEPERKPGSGGLGLCSQAQSQLTSPCCPHLCSSHLPRQRLCHPWEPEPGHFPVPQQPHGSISGEDPSLSAPGGGGTAWPWEEGAHGWGVRMELLAGLQVLGHPQTAEAVALTSCANQK